MQETINYTKRVDDYLAEIGVKVEVKPADIQSCPSLRTCKPYVLGPSYGRTSSNSCTVAHDHGHCYEITLTRDTRTAPPAMVLPSAYAMLAFYVSDGYAVDSTFEQWCGDLGYDTDSRGAEKIYNECVQTGIKLNQFFGAQELDHLRDIAQ